MPKKKSSEPKESAKNQELVRRVDKMMSTELPADVPAKSVVMADEPDDKKPAPSAPKNQKTAPELSPKLLKDAEAEKVEVTKLETPDKPPIVISLADEDMTSEKQLDEPPSESPEETPEEPAIEAKPEAAPTETDKLPQAPAKDPLEDNATDKAVDDIVAHEGDTVLAVNDALTARKEATAQPGRPSGARSHHRWFWLIILIILLGTAADVAIYLTHR
jgi:hypothetical protein